MTQTPLRCTKKIVRNVVVENGVVIVILGKSHGNGECDMSWEVLSDQEKNKMKTIVGRIRSAENKVEEAIEKLDEAKDELNKLLREKYSQDTGIYAGSIVKHKGDIYKVTNLPDNKTWFLRGKRKLKTGKFGVPRDIFSINDDDIEVVE